MAKKISQSVQELHARFVGYGRNAREWMRKCVMLLPEIERERVWEKKGFESIYVYAAKLAGMSQKTVNDALRVLRVTEGMSAIHTVIEERGINAVRPILTILNENNQEFWAEKATSMSQHTLEMYRRELETQERALPENTNSSQQKAMDISERKEFLAKKIIPMDLDPEVADQLEKLRGEGDWNVLMREFIDMREKVLEQEQQRIQEEVPGAAQASSRHIPMEIQRFVITRSRSICEFPKCTRTYMILHHTQRFALEEVHDPARIVALCTAHERIVHHGLVENENEKPENWRVRERPVQENPTYVIDQQVMKYRRPKEVL